ncbi:MAG: DoxX family membrane protein [Candidatus Taylorbacteria bacterium]|nr:DoxX family membrane protein [Candidatus Taylorbacteria bacterium]
MTTAFLIGRIVFALYWLVAAYDHLFKSDSLVGYTASKGVKSAKFAVIGTGVLLLLGGLSILLGLYVKIGIVLLVIFLIGVSFKMHAFWKETEPMARMGDRINFTKNMALAGALLMLLAIPLPWALSISINW